MGQIEKRFVAMEGKLECRAAQEDGPRVIAGYAAVFNEFSKPIWGWFREQIAPGAFEDADMSNCVALYNHNTDDLLARVSSGTLKLTVDERGLYFEFEVPNTTVGNDVYELVKRGDISQCSFAFTVKEENWNYSTEDDQLDERTIVKFGEIRDISLVVNPAYEGTSVDARSAEQDAHLQRKQEYLSKIDNEKIMAESESRARLCQMLALGSNAN